MSGSWSNRLFMFGFLLSILIAIWCRVPNLLNGDFYLTSDEAVHFLSLKHSLDGTLPTLQDWSEDYIGFSENLLVYPLLCVFGWKTWLVKLSSLLGFVASLVTVGLVTKWLYGRRACIMSLLFFSVLGTCGADAYSCISTATGNCFIPCLGLLGSWFLAKSFSKSSIKDAAIAGAIAGFGLYSHQHMVFWLIPMIACLIIWCGVGIMNRTKQWQRIWLSVAFVITFYAIWSLHFIPLKPPSTVYTIMEQAFLTHANVQDRLSLLWAGFSCIFGNMPAGNPADLTAYYLWLTIPTSIMFLPASIILKVSNIAGGVKAILLLLSLVISLGMILKGLLTAFLFDGQAFNKSHFAMDKYNVASKLFLFILLLVAILNITLCAAIDKYFGATACRYLLPLATVAFVTMGAITGRKARYGKQVSCLVVALVILQLSVHFSMHLKEYTSLSPVLSEPLCSVITLLREKNIQVGYADYWVAYKMDFLGNESPLIAVYPYATTAANRSVQFSQLVNSVVPKAYIFAHGDKALQSFTSKLYHSQTRFIKHNVAGYHIFVIANKQLI